MTKPKGEAIVQCYGKDKLQSMSLAAEVARRMSGRHQAPIKPYKCQHCEFYHVGEQHTGGRFYGRPKIAGQRKVKRNGR